MKDAADEVAIRQQSPRVDHVWAGFFLLRANLPVTRNARRPGEPLAPSLRAMIRKPSCLSSCSQPSPALGTP